MLVLIKVKVGWHAILYVEFGHLGYHNNVLAVDTYANEEEQSQKCLKSPLPIDNHPRPKLSLSLSLSLIYLHSHSLL